MTNENKNTKSASHRAHSGASARRLAAIFLALALTSASVAASAARNDDEPDSGASQSARRTDSTAELISQAGSREAFIRALRRIAAAQAAREESEKRGAAISGESSEDAPSTAAQAIEVSSPSGKFAGETRFEDGVTLVDAAAFARFAGASDVTFDGVTLRAIGGGFDVTLTAGTEYVESSGRCFWTRRTLFFEDETVFAPISALAAAFGYRAEGDGDRSVHLTGGGAITPADEYYDADDLCWLSHIIYAESGCEPFAGKLAVGSVVLNRVRSDQYPDSVYGVVFDRACGVQFSPTENGTIYLDPSPDAIAAAKICLEGYTVSDEISFFFNPDIAESSWISSNRPWVMTIGNHAFYS